MTAFLANNPLDPMSLNLAIQAAGVCLNITATPDLAAEFFAYGYYKTTDRALTHPVPMVPMEVFVLTFPHFLRYTEIMKNTRYMHPFRFAKLNYDRDLKASKSYTVNQSFLDV